MGGRGSEFKQRHKGGKQEGGRVASSQSPDTKGGKQEKAIFGMTFIHVSYPPPPPHPDFGLEVNGVHTLSELGVEL